MEFPLPKNVMVVPASSSRAVQLKAILKWLGFYDKAALRDLALRYQDVISESEEVLNDSGNTAVGQLFNDAMIEMEALAHPNYYYGEREGDKAIGFWQLPCKVKAKHKE